MGVLKGLNRWNGQYIIGFSLGLGRISSITYESWAISFGLVLVWIRGFMKVLLVINSLPSQQGQLKA